MKYSLPLLVCLAVGALGALALQQLTGSSHEAQLQTLAQENQRLQAEHEKAIAAVNQRLEQLRDRYNRAVARTAVTELVVEDGRLAVVVRTIQGELRRIQTPYDPSREVYVDYVVVDGRLWIRRVFDDRTRPEEALVIDPQFTDVDWSAPAVRHGKAVYGRLQPGRWLISVSGDGSLGLVRATEPAALKTAPPIGEFEVVR